MAKHNYGKWFSFGWGILVTIASFFIGMRFGGGGDASGYLANNVIHTPVLPLILDIIGNPLKFPGNYILWFIYISLGWYAIYRVRKFILKHYNISLIQEILILLLLTCPYFTKLFIANKIMTEGLAYPLFLIVLIEFREMIYNRNWKRITTFGLFLVLTILTRPHLQFVLGTFFLYSILMIILSKSKQWLWLMLYLIVLYFVAGTLDRTYHLAYHERFGLSRFTGIQLSVSAFYCSQAEDLNAIKDTDERMIFQETYDSLKALGTLRSIAIAEHKGYYAEYVLAFDNICWKSIVPIGERIIYNNHPNLRMSKYDLNAELDRKLLELSKILILRNYKNWLKLYVSNFLTGWEPLNYVMFMTSILLLVLVKSLQRKSSYYIFLLIMTLHLANVGLVSIVEFILPRYLFYTNILIAIMIILYIGETKQLKSE